MSPAPLRVGTPWLGYNERRNFADLPVQGVRFVRTRDPYALLHAARSWLGRARDERVRFRHAPPSLPPVDLFHFFNTVSSGTTPWVVTFETGVPRGGLPAEIARRLVESPACRRLIAMSRCARDVQARRWEREHGGAGAVLRKMEVLHPPQEPLVADVAAKPDPTEGLRFVFVGRQLFRKGGRPMLAAFDELLRGGADVHLHVISTLESGDRWSRATPADAAAARELTARHAGRITLEPGAPNARVLEALRGAHVLLLPTLAETYGYSVLEGQAAGCACITTNVRALPEINTDATGWMLELETTEMGSVRLQDDEQLRAAESAIRAGIVRTVGALLAAPGEVLRRGAAGLARIRDEHDPERAATRLAAIYGAALER